MLRTDHVYPRTVMMPLEPSRPRDSDMGELSMSMPAPLPSGIEPLTPSPRRTNNPPPLSANQVARKAVYIPQGVDQQGRQTAGVYVRPAQPAPRKPVPLWLVATIGALWFAAGYLVGRFWP